MNVAVAAFSVSAVVGLLVGPVARNASWAGSGRALALGVAFALVVVAALLALTGDWVAPAYALTCAVAVLVPCWLGRAPGSPPTSNDGGGEPEDESGGGGGGGLRKPPQDPPPAPPSPGLDWDAFDEARESWAAREPAR